MKAIVFTHYGAADVLQVKKVQKPTPVDNEILIKVHATEATKSDCEMRSFTFAVKWFWLPLRLAMGVTAPKKNILGGYFSGEIESIGADVSTFNVGDKVFGSAQLRMGAYGEYICLPADYTIVPKPMNLSYEEAAAVPLGGLNALHYLRKTRLKKGQHILINGAGGSIGTFAIQLAKAMGAEVTAVDSAIKEPILRKIGADHFIDYQKQDFTKQSQHYDVIFNMVAGINYSNCIQTLKPNGLYLMANPRLSDMLRSVFTAKLTQKNAIFAFAKETPEELLTLKAMIEDNRIKPIVDKIYTMDAAANAHQHVETEQRLGSVVITIAH